MRRFSNENRTRQILSTLLSLDCSCLKHLLAEVILVLSDGTIPPSDGLVFANHDVLSNLIKESRIAQVSTQIMQEELNDTNLKS